VILRTIHNYVIKQQIGQGGMGAVYLAEHARIGRRVAIKVLLPATSAQPDLVRRFFNEAKAAAEIRNPHIVDVIDFGELEDGTSYIIMEWLEGRSLAEALAKDGRIAIPRAVHIARGIGRALTAAHERGIVHRDLKPDNIMLVRHDDDADFVKVLDFGIAKLTMSGASDVQTVAGAIMGTPHYMSPEQCRGAVVDQRTDVYALGVILYEMLSGRRPFAGSNMAELFEAHLHQTPPPLRAIDPKIPPTVEQAILQALAKDPDKRFARVDALVNAFADVLTGPMPVTIPPPGSPLASSPVGEARVLPTVAPPMRAAGAPPPRNFLTTLTAQLVPLAEKLGIRTRRAQLIALAVSALFAVVMLWLAFRSPPMAVSADGAVVPAERVDLVDKLYSARSCRERRTAALQLIALDDKRYLESLRAARERKGGFLGLERVNGCMSRELDAAIRRLETK
jgi:eukaryotic-like serine/threonine-protein kinase